jgi:hypothetical protein
MEAALQVRRCAMSGVARDAGNPGQVPKVEKWVNDGANIVFVFRRTKLQ